MVVLWAFWSAVEKVVLKVDMMALASALELVVSMEISMVIEKVGSLEYS